MKKIAEKGDQVTVSYIGTLDNGKIFDSTEDEPLQITLGNDEIFAALEDAIIGMQVGTVKNILIHSCDAYGPRQTKNILKINRDMFPVGKEIQVGQKISLEFGEVDEQVLMIIDHNENQVILDANHPLAGLDLTFALRLDKINSD